MTIKSNTLITIGGVLLSLIAMEISKSRSQKIVIDAEAIKQAVRQREKTLIGLQTGKWIDEES